MTDWFADDPRSNRERLVAGDWYIADDPKLTEEDLRVGVLMAEFREAYAHDREGARRILGEMVGHLGEDVVVRPPLYVDYGFRLHLGDRTFVNFNLTALDVADIRIGADCQIGPNVQLLTPVHAVPAHPRREKLEAARPITLEDNVWLGGGVIVLSGVTIGADTIVGAGSVVTKDLPSGVIAVGNPARVVRELPTEFDVTARP